MRWERQEESLLAVLHVLVLSLLCWVGESLACRYEVVPKLNTDYSRKIAMGLPCMNVRSHELGSGSEVEAADVAVALKLFLGQAEECPGVFYTSFT